MQHIAAALHSVLNWWGLKLFLAAPRSSLKHIETEPFLKTTTFFLIFQARWNVFSKRYTLLQMLRKEVTWLYIHKKKPKNISQLVIPAILHLYGTPSTWYTIIFRNLKNVTLGKTLPQCVVSAEIRANWANPKIYLYIFTLTGTHSQWTQYMTPKGGPRSGCHVCSNSNVWSPKRHSAKKEYMHNF